MKYPRPFALKIADIHLKMLGDLARSESDRPSDSEVIRRLIEKAHLELLAKKAEPK